MNNNTAARLIPPRIVPPAQPLKGLAFLAAFVRNPLEVTPQAVYEQDTVVNPLGRTQRLWITSPALVKTVLLDEREKFQKLSQIRLLSPLLGKGILTTEGAEWKWQRQASAPMFRYQDLIGFVPAFVRATEAQVARWRAAPPGSVQAIDRDMTRATFDVISATLLPSADHATGGGIDGPVPARRRLGTALRHGRRAALAAAARHGVGRARDAHAARRGRRDAARAPRRSGERRTAAARTT